ncbi:MAG: hypothetical protein WD552_00655 [Candidatus Paceibacterota bacterium]
MLDTDANIDNEKSSKKNEEERPIFARRGTASVAEPISSDDLPSNFSAEDGEDE